jgi:ceramide glucosyltransferase
VQCLFGVASESDPACELVRSLLREFPEADASLVVCGEDRGANAKVAKLIQLQRLATHEIIVVSDADVLVPPSLLTDLVAPLQEEGLGLVSCFYRLANPVTLAMQWEAVAVNADFWSQVLQSNTLKPMDFALGAVMGMRRPALESIGGFTSLADCLADDYQLGNRMIRQGFRLGICPVVVECWDPPQGWGAVWRHQLRWARTIRVCQPVPYFLSILNNATLWPLLWVAVLPSAGVCSIAGALLLLRILLALDLQRQLTPDRSHLRTVPLVWLKDLLGVALWVAAFLGNTIEWRGRRLRLRKDGTLAD